MKTLLLKIKDRLHEKLTYLPMKGPDERAIYITTDGTLPEITDFPAVGLKDGEALYELNGGPAPTAVAGEYDAEFDKQMTVEVTAFVQLHRTEGVITGDGTVKGILDVVGDIKTALEGWLPDAAYNEPLIPVREGASQVYVDRDGEKAEFVQTKLIIFRCARQD